MATQRAINKERMNTKAKLGLECTTKLKGKTIKTCRYMTDEEMKKSYWCKCPLVIIFTDGTAMYASADDEGNDGGALFTTIKGLEVIPTI
jgi:hypothetical protein